MALVLLCDNEVLKFDVILCDVMHNAMMYIRVGGVLLLFMCVVHKFLFVSCKRFALSVHKGSDLALSVPLLISGNGLLLPCKCTLRTDKVEI